MKLSAPHREADAHFDITAMVDIVLLLIIFFSFTAQFSRSLATPMDLPKEPGARSPSAARHAVTIDLTASGTLRIEGRDVDGTWLLQTLARDVRAAGGPENIEVIVRADRGCAAAHLNNLAASLSSVGVRTWKLATEGGS